MEFVDLLKDRVSTKFPYLYEVYNDMKGKRKKKILLQDEKYVHLREKACQEMNSLEQILELVDLSNTKKESRLIYDFYEAVLYDKLVSVSQNWSVCPMDLPVFVCVVKNDLQRVRLQLEHYKKIGINHFVYIDNGSNDGTFEWLMRQEEVNLYYTTASFNATRKDVWIRKITDIYGYNRWYLICDSDELFVYPNYEKILIGEYIRFLEKKKVESICTIMIDMYCKGAIYEEIELSDEEIMKNYCWFDKNGYETVKRRNSVSVYGGARQRIFGEKGRHFNELVKYPLVKLQNDDLYLYHSIGRVSGKIDKKIHGILKHYKFLPKDSIKYKQIVKDGNYAGESAEYKRYIRLLDKNKNATFYYNGSHKFNCSKDIMQIDVFDSIFYKDYMKE